MVAISNRVFHIILAAIIGFDPASYTVTEGTDQFANITVRLISGELAREVVVEFTTSNGSALSGKCIQWTWLIIFL